MAEILTKTAHHKDQKKEILADIGSTYEPPTQKINLPVWGKFSQDCEVELWVHKAEMYLGQINEWD